VGTRFSARPHRLWGPPSLLYNGYRVFPGDRGGRGVGLTPPPQSSAKILEIVELFIYSPFLAYKRVKPKLYTYIREDLFLTGYVDDCSVSSRSFIYIYISYIYIYIYIYIFIYILYTYILLICDNSVTTQNE